MSQPKPVHLVVGATGGIGSVVCRHSAAAGAHVALAARDRERLEALAPSLSGSVHPVDAADLDAMRELTRELVATHGRLDGLALCVGSILLKPAGRTTAEEWRATLRQNLDTAFCAVAAGTDAMRKTGGSIVLVSSAAASVGMPNHEAVAAAKAGVEGLARSAAASQASRGIRVNVVAPGLVRTPLAERWAEGAAGLASAERHPLGRIGEPEDVARAISWLLDAEQSWVTGQVLGVDGGLASLRTH